MLGTWGAIGNLVAGPSSPMPNSEVARLAIALLPFVATAVAFEAARTATLPCARASGGAAVMLGVLAGPGGVLHVLANT